MADEEKGVAEVFEIPMPDGGFMSEALYVKWETHAEVRLLSRAVRIVASSNKTKLDGDGKKKRTVTIQDGKADGHRDTYFMYEPEARKKFGDVVIDKVFSEAHLLKALCGSCGKVSEPADLKIFEGGEYCDKCFKHKKDWKDNYIATVRKNRAAKGMTPLTAEEEARL